MGTKPAGRSPAGCRAPCQAIARPRVNANGYTVQTPSGMKTSAFPILISLISFCGALATQAQSGTQATITFVDEEKEKAREQLKRILSKYDLDPWIFTQRVQIVAGVDPHSHPILTLNTDFLDNDELQLSVFLHEQAHWFVSRFVPPSP